MKSSRESAGWFVRGGALLGLCLLAINLYGLTQSLRSPLAIADPMDFSHPRIVDSDVAWTQLSALDISDRREFAMRANEIIGGAMKHEPFTGKDYNADIYAASHLTVPLWENYFLFLFSYLHPVTFRSFHFTEYRRALERGIGQCEQQAITVVGFLQEHGFNTGFVIFYNGRHVTATAEVEPGQWVVLDPDYGLSIPHSIEELSANRELVEFYYAPILDQPFPPWEMYSAGPHKVELGDASLRYPRARVIEAFAYFSKWTFPIALLGVFGLGPRFKNRRRATGLTT